MTRGAKVKPLVAALYWAAADAPLSVMGEFFSFIHGVGRHRTKAVLQACSWSMLETHEKGVTVRGWLMIAGWISGYLFSA